MSSDFRIIVHYALTFYETVVSEIDDIIQDLEQTISDHHIKRLNHIGIIASKLNRDIGQIWHTKYPNKQYGNPHFLIIERIYGNTRDMAVNLLDFQNIAERLEDFKGRNKMVKQNNPWISGSFYLFVFLAIITAIAVLLNVLDWKIIPIVLIIGIISITIIGLLQLKNDRIITDHTFLESLREILNRIPLLKSILSDKSK